MGTAVKWVASAVVTAIVSIVVIALIVMVVLLPGINKALEPQCGTPGAASAGDTMVAGGWTVPLGEPYLLRDPFGMRFHPIYHEWRMHEGVDIVSSISNASPILAAHDGVVTWANYGTTDAGNNVNVDHGGGVVTRYMHLKSIAVTVGQHVKAGQLLGIEGTTGASTGEHLHFEYREGATSTNPTSGTPIDPITALQAKGITWDGKPGGSVAAPAGAASSAPTVQPGGPGQALALDNPAPNAAPTPDPGAGIAPAACPNGTAGGGVSVILDGTETTVRAYLTGYDWWDNSPRKSFTIARTVVHSQAGGTGTYDDPITAAVIEKYPLGTRFYMPNVRRYFVVEDEGDTGMLNPEGGASIWIDQWVDGHDVSYAASQACAGKVTGVSTVIVNPKPGYPVAPGRGINHDGICDAGYGDAVAAPK